MRALGPFLRLFEPDFLPKLLLLVLAYSLLPLGEIFFILYLGDQFGDYLTLAAAATTGLFGALLAIPGLRTALADLRVQIRAGAYPGAQFMEIAGIVAGGILLLTPGFLTDLFGFLLFLTPIRRWLGKRIARSLDSRLHDVYEYLRLYDLD